MSDTTAQSCALCGHSIVPVKKHFDYAIEDIPFRTKTKISMLQCTHCGECYIEPADVTIVQKDMDANKAALAKQDQQYRMNDVVPMSIFCPECGKLAHGHNNPEQDCCLYCGTSLPSMFDGHSSEYAAPVNPKQWISGEIVYNMYDENNEYRVRTAPFTVYTLPENVGPVAAIQFQRPNGFKAIIGLKVWGLPHTVDSFSAPCYAPPA